MHDSSTKVHVRLFAVSATISILDDVFIPRTNDLYSLTHVRTSLQSIHRMSYTLCTAIVTTKQD